MLWVGVKVWVRVRVVVVVIGFEVVGVAVREGVGEGVDRGTLCYQAKPLVLLLVLGFPLVAELWGGVFGVLLWVLLLVLCCCCCCCCCCYVLFLFCRRPPNEGRQSMASCCLFSYSFIIRIEPKWLRKLC